MIRWRVTGVSIRDLRNHGGDVIDRVAAGERVVVTRDGRPVAELQPLASSHRSMDSILERFRHLPAVDPDRWRADVDALFDQSL